MNQPLIELTWLLLHLGYLPCFTQSVFSGGLGGYMLFLGRYYYCCGRRSSELQALNKDHAAPPTDGQLANYLLDIWP